MLEQYAQHNVLDSPFGKEITDVSQPIWDLAMLGEMPVRDAVMQIQEACTPVMQKNKDWAAAGIPR